MGRPIRIEYPGALYHITSRGNERKDIFRESADREKFLGIVADYHNRFGILVHAYVLMDNHYHLVLETPWGNLVKIMHGINGAYTSWYNRKYNRIGHLFSGRYRAILVDKDSYLVELSRYVHLNPVRAGMSERPEHYAWSSFSGYIRKEKELAWMEYAGILSQFGTQQDRSRKKYREYVKQGIDKEGSSIFKELVGQAILGQDKFIEDIKCLIQGKVLDREITERKRLKQYPSPEAILAAVAAVTETQEKAITPRGSRQSTARKMAIYLMKRYSGLTNQEVGGVFGGLHYSAISQVSIRFGKILEGDSQLKNQLEAVMSKVKT
jgi:putative transposase